MLVDRIKFSKEFFILGAGEWVTLEASIIEGEDPIECIKELKQKMISMYGGNGASKWPPESSISWLSEDKPSEKIINRAYERIRDEIADCKTMEELAKLKPDLPTDLMPDYMNKLKSLTQNLTV